MMPSQRQAVGMNPDLYVLCLTALGVLTPDLLARVASGLSIDRTLVEKGSSATVPALLAALTSLVAKPGGAAKLSNAVAQQQPGIARSRANTTT